MPGLSLTYRGFKTKALSQHTHVFKNANTITSDSSDPPPAVEEPAVEEEAEEEDKGEVMADDDVMSHPLYHKARTTYYNQGA